MHRLARQSSVCLRLAKQARSRQAACALHRSARSFASRSPVPPPASATPSSVARKEELVDDKLAELIGSMHQLADDAKALGLSEDEVDVRTDAILKQFNIDLGALRGRLPTNLGMPDLMEPEPIYDLKYTQDVPRSKISEYDNQIIVRNDPPMFMAQKAHEAEQRKREGLPPTEEEGREEDEDDEDGESTAALFALQPYTAKEREKLFSYPIMQRLVVQQTGKGRIMRSSYHIVVGNGNGLVGIGSAKHSDTLLAIQRAFSVALRNMDVVHRFEKRTIWTEMEDKMGGTHIILRPRPVGFGLRCNPVIHHVLKMAGIKDISAKVWGSRNKLNVVRLLFRMIHAGNAPLGMGDGFGGSQRNLDKGSGVRGKREVEMERGRKLYDFRT